MQCKYCRLRRNNLVHFNVVKIQLSFFHLSNSYISDVTMNGSALDEKSSFKMLELSFTFDLYWCSYIVSLNKTTFKKVIVHFCSLNFLSPDILR